MRKRKRLKNNRFHIPAQDRSKDRFFQGFDLDLSLGFHGLFEDKGQRF